MNFAMIMKITTVIAMTSVDVTKNMPEIMHITFTEQCIWYHHIEISHHKLRLFMDYFMSPVKHSGT